MNHKINSIDRIRETCRCGACMGKIAGRVNLVALDRRATWEYPSSGNVLTGESGQAVAIMCDRCCEANRKPLEAVEFRGKQVVYHLVETLEQWTPAAEAIAAGERGPDCEQLRCDECGDQMAWVECPNCEGDGLAVDQDYLGAEFVGIDPDPCGLCLGGGGYFACSRCEEGGGE